jgi:ornithine cyclodeaminase/alanine dehydrogenase-like protein (mu-crystallin family)
MMGDMLIYEADTGILKAVMDAEYITTLRTGAVAAHSALLFGKKNFSIIGLLGLGNIMTACFETLLAALKKDGDGRKLTVKLYKHHGQEERFAERLKDAENVQFIFCDTYEEVFRDSM